MLAAGLFKTFSARGLVPDAVASDPAFLGAIVAGGMATVLLATVIGMPVSTTHALTGALVGAGLVAVGSEINVAMLSKTFLLPLLLSPVMSMALTMGLYPLAHRVRKALGVTRDSCVCVGATYVPISSLSAAARAAAQPSLSIGTPSACVDRYQGRLVGVSVQRSLDSLHFVSAGVIYFARALNATPKILALCLSAHALGVSTGVPVFAAAMAAGGLVSSRKVAVTMAKKIAPLNAGQAWSPTSSPRCSWCLPRTLDFRYRRPTSPPAPCSGSAPSTGPRTARPSSTSSQHGRSPCLPVR